MIRLRNIKITDDTASADYIPEDSERHGYVVVDLNTKEIVQHEGVDGYGASYRGHARAKLVELSKTQDIPDECIVMWC